MKKVLTAVTLTIFLAVNSICFAANDVDVCDFDSNTFVKNYNHLVKFRSHSNSVAINTSLVMNQSSRYSEAVVMPLKNFNDGVGVVIGLVIDQQGYIWEINIQNNSKILFDDMMTAFELALYTAGLEQDEVYGIIAELENTGSANQYIPSIERYLAIGGDALHNDGIGRIEISAYTD